MRDALGGTVTVGIILVFIVFALGYMAFNVNYTKAFRMKDKILSVYDDYNGDCSSGKCQAEISAYAKEIGYNSGSGTGRSAICPKKGGYKPDSTNTYCIATKSVGKTADGKDRKYYNIATSIFIEIPVFQSALNYNIFYVFGSTKTYKFKPNS